MERAGVRLVSAREETTVAWCVCVCARALPWVIRRRHRQSITVNYNLNCGRRRRARERFVFASRAVCLRARSPARVRRIFVTLASP